MSRQPEEETSSENTQHKELTFMPPAGFKPAIQASERSQTHTLDGAVTGIGHSLNFILEIKDIINTRT
jgi:hypothetical protein